MHALAAAGIWRVTHVVDGDTLDVASTTGVVERVRLIGVDTPERGERGFSEATDALRQLAWIGRSCSFPAPGTIEIASAACCATSTWAAPMPAFS